MVNLRQLSPNPVQLDKLSSRINSPGVSVGRNTEDAEGSEYTDGEELNCLATTSRAVSYSTESSTRISDPTGDQQQIDDQYRPMTPGEEEILRIHEDGMLQT